MLTGIILGWLVYWLGSKLKNIRQKQIVQMHVLSARWTPEGPPGSYPVKIDPKNVKDGDTFRATYIMLPWSVGITEKDVRCLGYDAWETSHKRQSVEMASDETEKGKLAKKALQDLVKKAQWMWLKPSSPEYDCYGRVLGFLYLQMNGEVIDVSEWMKANGHDRSTA